jgi:hypothetical protein
MAFMYNYLTNKRYKVCYYISVVCLTLANISYASADSANSLALMIVGRIFLGAGGARIVTRKFVALMVVTSARTKYSAIFVAFTALGKTGGPGLSSVFQLVPDFELGPWNWRFYNAFSFVAVGMWGATAICVFVFFQDIQKEIEKTLTKIKGKSRMFSSMGQLSRLNLPEIRKLNDMKKKINLVEIGSFHNSGINFRNSNINLDAISKIGEQYLSNPKIDPLSKSHPSWKEEEIGNAVNKQEYEKRKSFVKYAAKDNDKTLAKRDSVGPESKELTIMVEAYPTVDGGPMQVYFPNKITWFCFWCFIVCKSIQESFFYETPQVMKEYYGWTSKDVGFAIAGMAVFSIPIALAIAP